MRRLQNHGEKLMTDERELLGASAERILASDPEIRKAVTAQLAALKTHVDVRPALENVRAKLAGGFETADTTERLGFETIVNRVGRPVLRIDSNGYVLEGPESAIWEPRLGPQEIREAFRSVIPSVGRIDVQNHPDGMSWVGTGWLVDDGIIVTNRHVANLFCSRSGQSFVFRRGWPNQPPPTASIDFKELKPDDDRDRLFAVVEILYIEDGEWPDVAFFRVAAQTSAGMRLSRPLDLASQPPSVSQYVATIGYPASDSRVPDEDLVRRLFGDVYNVKRMAPGQVLPSNGDLVLHDCSTLGGNSGSPIVDLQTRKVVGLHFSGLFLRENRGVPTALVADRLERAKRPVRPPIPDTGESGTSPTAPGKGEDQCGRPGVDVQAPPSGPSELTLTIPISPIHVTIKVGGPVGMGGVTLSAGQPPAGQKASVDQAVTHARTQLGSRSDVLAVRDGYVFRNGWITDERAVVVVLQDAEAVERHDHGVPSQFLGVPVEVRAPGPWDFAEAHHLLEILEGLPPTTYQKPSDFALEEVAGDMRVICNVSPDAGWPTLRDFLEGTKKRLTIGMYDFTAPHVIEGVLDAVDDTPRRLALVMQMGEALQGKPDDIPEKETIKKYKKELKDRFQFSWASVGSHRQFASAYHIKVAVRDGKSFWLSSGNWQSSNQPDLKLADGEKSWNRLLKYNREWHVVIANADLARQYEKYLQYDLEQATRDADREAPVLPALDFFVSEIPLIEERAPEGDPEYFKPLILEREVRVQPLLTPDNYQEQVLRLIQGAQRQILFQNQSFSLLDEEKNDARFAALADAILEKQKKGIDVRIIIRGEFSPERPLEQLKKRGFKMKNVRLQNRCHTKGIIVDSDRVLLGSHNWTNQGTLVNRDASLIFFDPEIAAYYEKIFWFDWNRLARQSVAGGRRVRPADDREAPAGMMRVPWRALFYG
jgi:hypothetical protein